ncbi:hypothetical protein ABI_40940 [Asticcacaulis biprosthecium C19]|uniref:Uncharacterized protein n=1 Tax=Asticcacaulis biprosthecium C19 TaxID=715226 RepID=F4QSF1_9CAUL|nr:hypothetical protein [Asticcacaulis biprosthecium]EGF89671.1 hypothetical protein ABI_40940 [Asticcacaulis biprosthecium C19]
MKKRTAIALALCLLTQLGGAQTAFASDPNVDASQAVALYNEALEAAREGRNEDACRGSRSAAKIAEGTIGDLVFDSDFGESTKYEFIKHLQDVMKQATALAEMTCGQADFTPPASSSSGTDYSDNADNLADRVAEAARRSDQALAAYESGDKPTSCVLGRQAITLWQNAYALIQRTSADDSRGIESVRQNAETAQELADKYYCRQT